MGNEHSYKTSKLNKGRIFETVMNLICRNDPENEKVFPIDYDESLMT